MCGTLTLWCVGFAPLGSWMLKCSQAHPEAKKWRDTPFPYYDEIHGLIDGKHATGERAYRVSLTSDNEDNDMSLTNDVEDIDNDNDIGLTQSSDTTSQVSRHHPLSAAHQVQAHIQRRSPHLILSHPGSFN
jgi:hypothetical protein